MKSVFTTKVQRANEVDVHNKGSTVYILLLLRDIYFAVAPRKMDSIV